MFQIPENPKRNEALKILEIAFPNQVMGFHQEESFKLFQESKKRRTPGGVYNLKACKLVVNQGKERRRETPADKQKNFL